MPTGRPGAPGGDGSSQLAQVLSLSTQHLWYTAVGCCLLHPLNRSPVLPADAGTATPALPVSSPAKHASDNSSLNSFWVGQQPPAPWPMPPAQPAEQQNSQPSAAQNPRHARQASVRHSAAGVLTTRSTNSSSNINKRGRSISTRQPLGATQAHVCDERRRDAERPGRVADLKPQPPAAARSHANKSRPAKASATVSESYRSFV